MDHAHDSRPYGRTYYRFRLLACLIKVLLAQVNTIINELITGDTPTELRHVVHNILVGFVR